MAVLKQSWRPDDRLYCYGTVCADEAFAPLLTALKRVA